MVEKEKLFVDVYSKYSNDTDAEFPFPIGLDEYEDFAYSFFRLGKEQAINSIWHNGDETPNAEKNVFVRTIEHSIELDYTDNRFFQNKWPRVDEWCYVADIIKKW